MSARSPYRWNSVDAAAQPGTKLHALVGLQHQRIEEQLAELPVSDPGLALRQDFEGGNVDEDRLGAVPLHVVRGGVFQDHSLVQRLAHQLQVQQRGILQHPERPFVGVGNERNSLMLQDGRPVLRTFSQRVRRTLRADDRSRRDPIAKELASGEPVPVLQRLGADAAQNAGVAIEHRAVAVAIGAGLDGQIRTILLSTAPIAGRSEHAAKILNGTSLAMALAVSVARGGRPRQ